jgi:phosphatidylethanolamine/phosphatidyl-N-methylethanolamine N-methyltransferase
MTVFGAEYLRVCVVAPDGAQVFRKAWRVLRRNGTVVIFDKFLPEASRLSPMRRLAGAFISALGNDPNRRLSDLLDGISDLVIERNELSRLGGQYQILVLRKL